MEKYICKLCNYNTNRISNLDRHNNSERHIKRLSEYDHDSNEPVQEPREPAQEPREPAQEPREPVREPREPGKSRTLKNKMSSDDHMNFEYKCEFCGARFKHNQSYNRHKKHRCKKRDSVSSDGKNTTDSDSDIDSNTDTDNESVGTRKRESMVAKNVSTKRLTPSKSKNNIAEIMKIMMEGMMEMKKDIISQIDEKINNMQNDEKSDIIKIARNTAETSNKSMNILKFAMRKLQNAPPIKKLDKQEIMGLITYVPDGKTDEKNKHSIEEIIIYKYSKNILIDFVGDAIVECYSARNPKMQSVWGTDIARLMFIIKEQVGDSDKSEWVKDHNGTKILKLIIKPIYKKISEMMEDYTKRIYDTIKKKGISHIECARLTEQSEKAFEIKATIFNNKIQKATLRYIAPQFGITSSILNNIDDFDSPQFVSSSDDSSSEGSSTDSDKKKPQKIQKKKTK
jgi:hypothetical protein